MDINHDTKKLFMYAILCLSLAVGLSSGVFSNYFKEVFAVDSVQRRAFRDTQGDAWDPVRGDPDGSFGARKPVPDGHGLRLLYPGTGSSGPFIAVIFYHADLSFFLFPGRAYDDAPAGQHCHGSVGRGENGDFFRTA